MDKINKKTVIVTGASGGMGKAICSLLKKDYIVYALDVKDAHIDGVNFIYCDVTDENSVKEAYSTIKEKAREIYSIIHTAGIYDLDSLLEIEEERLIKIFNVNFFGAYRINKTFLPLLKMGSKIIMVTSELAPLSPLPFTGIYAVSKAALDKYAYSLRMELQLLGVSVSVLRAGAVDTGMLGVSTAALDRFCDKTELYACNSRRFKDIVDRVEARCVSTERLAKKAMKIIGKKKPSFAYSINRNPLLRLLNFLPKRLQLWIIKKILT